jgi:hypothetical protein
VTPWGEAELDNVVSHGVTDPWGTKYAYSYESFQGRVVLVTIISAGKDRKFGTADDLTVTGELSGDITDAAGRVRTDTKAERVASQAAFVQKIARKVGRSAVLAKIVESYCQAIADSRNELIHLYEVRDAIAEYYGSESEAQRQLSLTKKDWEVLGVLANTRPLTGGRHRGRHLTGTREPTVEEQEAARKSAKKMIEAFAATLP